MLESTFGVDMTPAYAPHYNIGPTQLAPIVTHSDTKGASFFYWGTDPELAGKKSVSKKLVQVPLDQLLHKTSYKNAYENRRCIILMDGFYAWKKVSKKREIPYRVYFSEEEPFAVAGIWDEYETPSGESVHTFSMLVKPSDMLQEGMEAIIPGIIQKGKEEEWLKEGNLEVLVESFPSLTMHPVSPKINDHQYNAPDLLLPVKAADQFGNYSLFD